MADATPPLHDLVCFHCQQGVEKYFKALLQEHGAVAPPRLHDLEDVLALLLPTDPTLRSLRRASIFLTQFAADYRYPGENASDRQAKAALRWAERIRNEIRSRIGLGK